MSSTTQGKYQQHIESLKPKGSLPLLGAEGSINALSDRIYEGLSDDNADQSDPLVVGLYGEWGSGKSFWLKWLQYNVLKKHFDEGDTAQIIPVFFNAWRYEKEEHLIIPLLKSTATAIKNFPDRDSKWKERFQEAAKSIALSTAALTYHLAKNLEEDVLKTKVISTLRNSLGTEKMLRKRFQNKVSKVQQATSELESQYFDFHTNMETMLENDGSRQIRLLFLIDDLDRCLPEKAVEMLESVKLFLEMPGTAFVLAVDDEVVERGIAHRYRDYRFNADANNNTENGSLLSPGSIDSPISGHEYLEKMIILPIRIDRAADSFVDEFIETRCKPLNDLKVAVSEAQSGNRDFSDEATKPDFDRSNAGRAEGKRGSEEFTELLKVIPSVPRKLLRLSELFQHRKAVLERGKEEADGPDSQTDLNALSLTEQMALLRLVALQLFAPEVYRLAQRTGTHSIFTKLGEILVRKEYKGFGLGYQHIYRLMENQNKEAEEGSENRQDRQEIQMPLLRALIEIQVHRAGFDPGKFLTKWSPRELTNEAWARLFGHPPVRGLNVGVTTGGLIEFDPTQLEETLSALVTASPSGWEQIIAKLPLGRLSDAHAEQLLTELEREISNFDDSLKPQWIQTNGLFYQPKN